MNKWLLLVGCLLFGGQANADLRVLFRFDGSGHFVHRVIPVNYGQDSSRSKKSSQQNASQILNSLPVSAIERGRSWKNAEVSQLRKKQANYLDGFVRLTWFDAAGVELAQTEVPDPRVAHSPSHAEGFNASRSEVLEGAWLATGPDLATSVSISLPESSKLDLAAEYWNLELRR
jgi:uncharacterized protein YcfL